MRLIKVGAAVLNQLPLDWEGNRARILRAISEARAQGITLLCLPELCVTGYGCEDAFHARRVQQQALALLEELVTYTRGMIVSFGVPVLHHNALYDCACLAADGKILGFTAKRHLAGDGVHYEPRWFKRWPENVRAEVLISGKRYLIGDLFFELSDVSVGFEICEDAWVAQRPGASLSQLGVDIILNPSASHFAFGKHEIRKRFVLEGSRAFGCTYVYANLLGNEAGRVIYDGDALIAACGKQLAQGRRFSFDEVQITACVIDVDTTRMSQARSASFRPDPRDSPGRVSCAFEFPAIDLVGTPVASDPWAGSPHEKEEEFVRAESLALFDYLRKSRSEGAVVSLSGGADSAATASLVRLAIDLGVQELGIDKFLARFSFSARLQSAKSADEIANKMLLCVYQATRNSSETTREAARTVALSLNAEFMIFDVDALVTSYTQMVSQAIGRPITWEQDDMPLQNIQARVRAPGVWMLANLRNSLLLSTSNRSEAAVGYATMDGDTSGGLAPIAGIDKNFLRRFLRWMEKVGPQGLRPNPALGVVNAQQPGPELRPAEQGQTGEKDLMPYDLLDAAERAAIRDKQLPVEVFHVLRAQFPAYSARQLATWIDRFFRLFGKNQWKRERYAPSFHLDDENLDPKTWCRFPILSSGFALELQQLWALPELRAEDQDII